MLLLALLLHLDLGALLGVFICWFALAWLGLPARGAVGPGTLHSRCARIGRGRASQLLGLLWPGAALMAVAVLLGRVAILRLVLVGGRVLPGF